MAQLDPERWRGMLGLDTLEQQHGLPQGLLTAVLRAESAGNPAAHNVGSGASGLFQFIPSTARAHKIDPYDPLQAAPAAAQELASHFTRYEGDLPKTLAAWNWGSGRLAKFGLEKAPAETRTFTQKVLGWLSPASAEAAESPAPPQQTGVLDIADFDRWQQQQHSAPAPTLDITDFQRGTATEQEAAQRIQQLRAAQPPDAETSPTETEAVSDAPATTPGMIEWLPGFEFLSVLPHAAQEKVIAAVPGLAKAAAAMGISAATTAGGAALGGLTGPAAPVLGPVGASAGSVAGHRLNVALGLEEPGREIIPGVPVTTGDAFAALPPLAPLVPMAGRAVARRLPGAAPVLHEEALAAVQAMPGHMAPPTPSAQLYAQAAQGNPAIPTTGLTQATQRLIAQETALQPSLRSRPLLRVATDVQALLQQHGGNVPLNTLRDHQQRLGLLLQQANRENWPQAAGLRRLYGAFHDAYDQAAAQGIPQADLLRQATQAARREFAVDDLAELFQAGRPGLITRPDGLVQIHGGRLLDAFNRRMAADDTLARSFTAGELNEMRQFLHELTRLPRIPPPRGQLFGSGAAIGRGSFAGGVTQALTNDPQLASTVGMLAAGAPHIISQALMTEPGRAMLRRLLRAHPALGPAELAALAQAGHLPMVASPGGEEAGSTAP